MSGSSETGDRRVSTPPKEPRRGLWRAVLQAADPALCLRVRKMPMRGRYALPARDLKGTAKTVYRDKGGVRPTPDRGGDVRRVPVWA